MEKIKYVNNRELLAEIHRSKVSFCSFKAPEYARYDAIVPIEEVTPEREGRARASRHASVDQSLPVVFRVMNADHIPGDAGKRRRGRGDTGQVRTNFPAFKHYILDGDTPVEVGRSHWKGDLETGSFCVDHGKITDRLATMFMLMVDRYSRRGNWRGYCVDTETEALTQRGWLRHDQITTDDLILSYDDGALRWSSIKSIFRDHYKGDMFRLTVQGMDALVTPGHNFITPDGLCKVEFLRERDKVVLTGRPVDGPEVARHPNAFVELVGWVVTEGTIYRDAKRTYPRISIYQNEGPKADRIRTSLGDLAETFGEGGKVNPSGKRNLCFTLSKRLCNQIAGVVRGPDKVLTMPFLLSLTQEQRLLLIETMIDADGYRHEGHRRRYVQKSREHVDAFVALCTMAGIRTSVTSRDMESFGKPTTHYHVTLISKGGSSHSVVQNIDFHGGKRNGTVKGRGKLYHPNEPTVPYDGLVWCPETEFGSFMARRNGYAYLTGNTYVDEMRNLALLQLSQIGLQFDEAKSDNPFAFYTTTVRNCFTRVLNIERRNQNIRDDLLIVAGAKPSMTRQINDEWDQRTDPRGNPR